MFDISQAEGEALIVLQIPCLLNLVAWFLHPKGPIWIGKAVDIEAFKASSDFKSLLFALIEAKQKSYWSEIWREKKLTDNGNLPFYSN